MTLKGSVAAEGIATAKAFVITTEQLSGNRIKIQPEEADMECKALTKALKKTAVELERLREKAYTDGLDEQGDIFSAYLELIQDDDLSTDVQDCIREKNINLNTALMDVCGEYASDMAALDDPYMQARADDFRQIFRMIADAHNGTDDAFAEISEDFILVAREVGPADMAKINKSLLKGIVTEGGSKTSHAAIVCRAADIPMLTGIHKDSSSIKTGTELIIDAEEGILHIEPDSETVLIYKDKIAEIEKQKEHLKTLKDKKAVTADGTEILLTANAATLHDIDNVLEYNASGIGLFRTEFLFMENPSKLPSEEEQFNAYKTVLSKMNGKTVVFRTLDAGGDKNISALGIPKEENPFLGWRAIRYCLKTPEVFRIQLRALLRASQFGKCNIMLPMVCCEQEVIHAKKLLDSVYEELEERDGTPIERVPFGIMIETPAAALIAETLAQHVDFFSIGSNDLTQYTVAVDRGNEYVADLYDEMHPAVLKLISFTVQAAKKAGISVHVCGEMAGDIHCTQALLNAGVRELSMSANRIPKIKDHLLTLHL